MSFNRELREICRLKGAALSAPFCFLVLVVFATNSLSADVLTGRWRIALTPDKATAERGEKEFSDTISFAGANFSSTALGAKGFKPAAYRGDFEEREAEFDLEQESETEGVAIWIGEVRGEKITGRLQWKKRDGTNLFFNFVGAKAAN